MEHSIRTIHKATLEHLLNFKRISDGGTTVCKQLLGFCFGRRDFEVAIVGLMVI